MLEEADCPQIRPEIFATEQALEPLMSGLMKEAIQMAPSSDLGYGLAASSYALTHEEADHPFDAIECGASADS